MFENRIKDLVLTSLVVDSYCLGMHWIYDVEQLSKEDIDWENLIAPKAVWHQGKSAGEFTHYGDQTFWLYEFLKDKNSFDENSFRNFWFDNMKSYKGYIDGASRSTILNIEDGKIPSGSMSSDLSIVGRIAPLLKVSNTKDEFLENVEKFVKLTHNSIKALETADFFAKLLILVLEGKNIVESILELKESCSESIKNMIEKAIDSKDEDTIKTIRVFGSACDINGGLSGVIHLLVRYDDFKEMIINNSKAGGDSSARGMIASIIFMANRDISVIPNAWLEIKIGI